MEEEGRAVLGTMADDLFSIKNEFYLGNFMGAINEAQSGDLELSTPADERDRDVMVSPPLPAYPCARSIDTAATPWAWSMYNIPSVFNPGLRMLPTFVRTNHRKARVS